jgi:hypothetical protein
LSNELYSNYVDRKPHPRNEKFISRWHERLLALALDQMPRPVRVLEVGPGHGYFAKACRESGFEYRYCDTSPSVHRKMSELGFEGHLGFLHELPPASEGFDLIWMSHVLEHSPTWLDARGMMESARALLNVGGAVVVVSPDVLTWRREFWNVDWSHGYPTSVRNVAQLMSDVGLSNIVARHHRNGSFSLLGRAVFAMISLVPHRLLDRIITPSRYRIGDGMVYSWKVVLGWRQIFVLGQK